ncbi:MAG: manganese efflux pump [Syntrophomonadaceae bacterium]|nr:manganese efflux pump [Syntrophomonadaceae bacterium]
MNELFGVFIVAISLGLDAFSVALSLGLSGISRLFKIQFMGVVAILHVLLPLVGLYLGLAVGNMVGKWASIIGAIVLAFIGLQMVKGGLAKEEVMSFPEARGKMKNNDRIALGGWTSVLVLGLSVSVDALVAGFGLGITQASILSTVLIMGMVAGLMTGLGWLGAKYCNELIGKRAEAFGGVILILLALKMLVGGIQ